MIPRSKPQASASEVETRARAAWAADSKRSKLPFPEKYVVAFRGYYQDTMGKPGENDIAIFDDAVFLVGRDHFSSWNFNTDPTRYGWNAGAGKYMARLKPGIWDFHRLKHKMNSPSGYMAWGQGGRTVTVQRMQKDGTVNDEETGAFGINLHRAGNTTSSEGCQTVPVSQWSEFDKAALRLLGDEWFPYILIEGTIN